MTNRKRSIIDLVKIVSQFNRTLPVGTKVFLRKDNETLITEVDGEAFLLGGHTPVAFFKGVPGVYSIEGRVEKFS